MSSFTDLIDAKEEARRNGKTIDHVELTRSMINEIMADTISSGESDRGDPIDVTDSVDVVIGAENVLVTEDGTQYTF